MMMPLNKDDETNNQQLSGNLTIEVWTWTLTWACYKYVVFQQSILQRK
jgi:hypothetical protein